MTKGICVMTGLVSDIARRTIRSRSISEAAGKKSMAKMLTDDFLEYENQSKAT